MRDLDFCRGGRGIFLRKGVWRSFPRVLRCSEQHRATRGYNRRSLWELSWNGAIVSIWTRKLWGKEESATPAGERAIRCARLRHAAGLDVVRLGPLSLIASASLFAVPVYIGVLIQRPAMTGPQVSLVEQVWKDSISAMPTLLPVCGSVLLLLWVMPAVGRWTFEVFGKKRLCLESLVRQRRQRAWLRTRRRHFVVGAYMALAGVIVIVCFDRMWGGLLAVLGAWAFGWTGVTRIMMGVTARRGTMLVCARCDYGMRSWRSAAETCAECGREWKKPWGARVGVKRVRWSWVWAGVGSLAAAVMMMGAFVLLASRR